MSDSEKRGPSLLASLQAQLDDTQRDRGLNRESGAGREERAAAREDRQSRHRKRSLRHDRSTGHPTNPSAQEKAASALPSRRENAHRSHKLASVAPLPLMAERRRAEEILLLPRRERKRSYGTLLSFLVFVALPIVLASIYYIFYASNQYVAEFRFAVREVAFSPLASTSTPGSASGLGSVQGTVASSSPAESYMVIEYLTSRQILDELEAKIGVKALYSRPDVDWWARFDASKPMEKFLTFWQSMVTADYDLITGIAVAKVRAFTPADAHLIATMMVSLAEKLVNQIAMRSRLDTVRYAEQEVRRAQGRLNQIRVQLTAYRDKEAVIDPTSNVVASNTSLAQTLRITLMQYQTELAALTRQNLRSDAPTVLALQSRIYAAKQQLAAVEAQVATAKEGNRPLSHVVGQYEKLDLERQVAQNILTGAVQSLEQARVNASVQSLYITPFVRPALPESSTYPNRFISILMVGFACFILWTVGLLVTRSIREHLA